MAYRGHYTPTNYQKYLGDPTKIIYRSLWERKIMVQFDNNPNVIGWASEEIVIPYYYPVDKSWHRYYVDFFVKYKKKDGSIQNTLIEVKPHKFTIAPKLSKNGKKTARFYTESYVFAKNSCKWEAAKKYAKSRGWDFRILTEDNIL